MPKNVPITYTRSDTPRKAGARLTRKNGNAGTRRRTSRYDSAFLRKARLEACQRRAGLGAQRVAQCRACGKEQQRGTDRRPDHGEHAADDCAEQESAGERGHRPARQRARDDDDVDNDIEQGRERAVGGRPVEQQRPVFGQGFEGHVSLQPGSEEQRQPQPDRGKRCEAPDAAVGGGLGHCGNLAVCAVSGTRPARLRARAGKTQSKR